MDTLFLVYLLQSLHEIIACQLNSDNLAFGVNEEVPWYVLHVIGACGTVLKVVEVTEVYPVVSTPLDGLLPLFLVTVE